MCEGDHQQVVLQGVDTGRHRCTVSSYHVSPLQFPATEGAGLLEVEEDLLLVGGGQGAGGPLGVSQQQQQAHQVPQHQYLFEYFQREVIETFGHTLSRHFSVDI